MADDVRITNLPRNEAQVGFDLYKRLRNTYKAPTLEDEFKLFSACINAAKGHPYTVPELTS